MFHDDFDLNILLELGSWTNYDLECRPLHF